MENKLKPCPFCGGEAKLLKGFPSQQGKWSCQRLVQCTKCRCRTVTFRQSAFESWQDVENAAIEAWNRRAE